MDEFHRRLARIALAAAADNGFALAGGYAVQAYGVLQRPSEDIDLFTSSLRDDFADGVSKICAAYTAQGLTVKVDLDSSHFVRLGVSDPAIGRTSKVELATDLRSHPPVTMEIGPVVHLEDVAGGKVEALFTRAEVRDFIDVDAFLTSGRFTRDRLLELAASRDLGFDRAVFAQMLSALELYPDSELLAYGLTEPEVRELRSRFNAWRANLAQA
ncbi:nucleotidyl transferase AbiEii/AbiGii toxin family protein [Nonomuraea basaltis]|uniref:nucleotidyl transferase AbiEii/AbiGii toxin family protein n=1 Tax=Nonomuraea basaltis TaxID=2495887 RepID=UPI00110C581D|nr:nucleotidyl transferase AbiEii/AbiGii toxin family protein [Nonomuraea basaltis]TMR94587.1 nucleotidyl transferase AbiEii/AbiGii toxin family protein [Nonomuraea basaltis]